jgi:hypothetical protein
MGTEKDLRSLAEDWIEAWNCKASGSTMHLQSCLKPIR